MHGSSLTFDAISLLEIVKDSCDRRCSLSCVASSFLHPYRVVAAATENWGLLRERGNWHWEVNVKYSALQVLRALQCFASSTSASVLCKYSETYSAYAPSFSDKGFEPRRCHRAETQMRVYCLEQKLDDNSSIQTAATMIQTQW